jgi:hypothetical protein
MRHCGACRRVELDGGQVAQDSSSGNDRIAAQLVERHRVFHPKRANGLASQAGEVGTNPETIAQIAGKGSDVSAGADLGSKGHQGCLKRHHLDSPHGDANFG